MTLAANRADVVVIGGGLAGISAAVELAAAGRAVTLIEGRPWLGGATCSFIRRGLTIDNGQHAFLRCCTAYRELLARLGVAGSCSLQDRLDLTVLDAAPGGQAQARLRRSALPAPAHLARSLAGYRLLSAAERLQVAGVAVALLFTDSAPAGGRSLGDWLARHRQDERARAKLWDWLCAVVLNVAPEHADLALAASAIRTAVLAGRDNADIGVPAVPLSGLHGGSAVALLGSLGVTISLGVRVTAVQSGLVGGYLIRAAAAEPGQSAGTPDAAPEEIRADAVVFAVPPGEAAALAPAALAGEAARWSLLRPSPMVSAHVIYGSRVTRLPFAAVVGSPVRWVIDKSDAAGLHAGQYLAASIPAADEYVDMPAAQLRERVLPVLNRVFPAAAGASIEDFFVTRERRATIRHEPGSQQLRPAAGLPGLAMAGAWTDTGWPDTMEGAVRSGRSAALKLITESADGPGPASARSAAGRVTATETAASGTPR